MHIQHRLRLKQYNVSLALSEVAKQKFASQNSHKLPASLFVWKTLFHAPLQSVAKMFLDMAMLFSPQACPGNVEIGASDVWPKQTLWSTEDLACSNTPRCSGESA